MLFRERKIAAGDGLLLACRDYGDPLSPGTPIFCLAGLARNALDFELLAERVCDVRRVVALDYRGRGRSDYALSRKRYKPEIYLDDALQVIAGLGLHRIVLCGTSFGGILSMALAVARPGAIAGVILNDIGPDLETSATSYALQLIKDAEALPDWETATARLKQVLPDLNLADDAEWLRFAKGTYRESADGTLRPDWDPEAIKAVPDDPKAVPDLWPYFRALRQRPVLVIRGALSEFLSEKSVERMRKSKPDMRVAVVPNRGHAPILNEPEATRAIDEFLEEIDHGRAGHENAEAR